MLRQFAIRLALDDVVARWFCCSDVLNEIVLAEPTAPAVG